MLMSKDRQQCSDDWTAHIDSLKALNLPRLSPGQRDLNTESWEKLPPDLWSRSGVASRSEWHPQDSMEQAMWLWSHCPPEECWLNLRIGIDGWIVQLCRHSKHTPTGVMIQAQTDDYGIFRLPGALTLAWIEAFLQSKGIPSNENNSKG